MNQILSLNLFRGVCTSWPSSTRVQVWDLDLKGVGPIPGFGGKDWGFRANSRLWKERKRVLGQFLTLERKKEGAGRTLGFREKERGFRADSGLLRERKRLSGWFRALGRKTECVGPTLGFGEKKEGVGLILGFGEKERGCRVDSGLWRDRKRVPGRFRALERKKS
jgi:hypothetical protein